MKNVFIRQLGLPGNISQETLGRGGGMKRLKQPEEIFKASLKMQTISMNLLNWPDNGEGNVSKDPVENIGHNSEGSHHDGGWITIGGRFKTDCLQTS